MVGELFIHGAASQRPEFPNQMLEARWPGPGGVDHPRVSHAAQIERFRSTIRRLCLETRLTPRLPYKRHYVESPDLCQQGVSSPIREHAWRGLLCACDAPGGGFIPLFPAHHRFVRFWRFADNGRCVHLWAHIRSPVIRTRLKVRFELRLREHCSALPACRDPQRHEHIVAVASPDRAVINASPHQPVCLRPGPRVTDRWQWSLHVADVAG